MQLRPEQREPVGRSRGISMMDQSTSQESARPPPCGAEIKEKRDALAALCRRYGVARLEVFGSAARDAEFDASRSDVDFLVTFTPDARNDLAAFR
jgi:Nucleotidyltransferase domain